VANHRLLLIPLSSGGGGVRPILGLRKKRIISGCEPKVGWKRGKPDVPVARWGGRGNWKIVFAYGGGHTLVGWKWTQSRTADSVKNWEGPACVGGGGGWGRNGVH